jgi:hypothetical protein
MFTQIEQSIISQLRAKGLAVDNFEIRRDASGVLLTPAAICHIETGKFTPMTFSKYRVDTNVFVDFVFQFAESGEEERRAGVYPILLGALGMLTNKKLGLDIHPLRPVSFQNITAPEDAVKGAIVFRLQFQTYFTLSVADERAATDLVSVGLSFYQAEHRLSFWAQNKVYAQNARIVPPSPNGHIYLCSVAGTSHATTPPVFPTTAGATVIDNTVTWTESGAVDLQTLILL